MIPKYELKAEAIQEMVLTTVENHLSLKTAGYRCSTEQTWNGLVKAAAEGRSWEAVCGESPDVVDSHTLREQLNRALKVAEVGQPEAEMNAALVSSLPIDRPRGGLEGAIATQDEPFYGKTPTLLAYTRKGKAREGTSRCFRIASAYVIWRQVRLTLALTYVLPDDTLPEVVERLLQRLTNLGLPATVL